MSPEYEAWSGMVRRCYDERNHAYARYGGRGIRMCRRWRHSFAAFLADMGRRPSPEHSLDRIDNDVGYRPDNCRWATPTEQANNRRSNARVRLFGEEKTVAAWLADPRIRVTKATVYRRKSEGMSLADALVLADRRLA